MKTLKQGDFIEYGDLKSYGLYYICRFAHLYLLTDSEMKYLVFYEKPITKKQEETDHGYIYSIIKYPHYENRKNTHSSIPSKN